MLSSCVGARRSKPDVTKAGPERLYSLPAFAALAVSLMLAWTNAPALAQESDQATAATEIPLELLMSRPLVRAEVHGHGPVSLLIDPQIQTTRLARSVIDLLEAAPDDVEPTVSLDIGEQTLEGIRVDVLDTTSLIPELSARAQPDGVLSLSVWKGQLVTLDYRRWLIRIEPGELPEPNGLDVLAIDPRSSELRVQLAVGGHLITCRVDPWFPGGLLLPSSYLAELALTDDPREGAPVATRKGIVAVEEAQLAENVSLGDIEYALPTVLFGDSGDAGLLGHGWLWRLAVTYDLANGRARLTAEEDSEEQE